MNSEYTKQVRIANSLPVGSPERRELLQKLSRTRTRNEVADKASAALSILNVLHLSPADENYRRKMTALLEEIIEIEEKSLF